MTPDATGAVINGRVYIMFNGKMIAIPLWFLLLLLYINCGSAWRIFAIPDLFREKKKKVELYKPAWYSWAVKG